MALVQASSEAHPSMSFTLAEAKDKMWEFQLRKENKAVLHEVRAFQKQRLDYNAEFEQKHRFAEDRIAALEARIVELEHMVKESVHAQESFKEEIAALSTALAENVSRKYSGESTRYVLAHDSHPLRSVPNTPTRSPQPDRRPADPRQRRNVRIAERNPSRGEQDNMFPRPPPGLIRRPQPQAQAEAGPSNERRHGTRSRTRIEPAANLVDAMPVPSGSSRIPRLNQGNKSMKDYYNNANAIFQSPQGLENDARFDVDFVGSFLRGLRNQKTKDKLVDELKQFYPSRVKKEGWIEVICGWEDVDDAIRRTGLFFEAEKMANKRQGRIMNPRTMVKTNI